MSEALLVQAAIGLFTIGGVWAVMRTQLARHDVEIEELRKKAEELAQKAADKADLAALRSEIGGVNNLITKVSLQVAYLNGQLSQRGLVAPSMPDAMKV